jgi:hypothetical protein
MNHSIIQDRWSITLKSYNYELLDFQQIKMELTSYIYSIVIL